MTPMSKVKFTLEPLSPMSKVKVKVTLEPKSTMLPIKVKVTFDRFHP